MRLAVDLEVVLVGDGFDPAATVGQLDQLVGHRDASILEPVVLDTNAAGVVGEDAVEDIDHRVRSIAGRRVDRRSVDRHIRQVGVEHAVVGVVRGVAVGRRSPIAIPRGMQPDVLRVVVADVPLGPHVAPHLRGLEVELAVVVDGPAVVPGLFAAGSAEVGRAGPDDTKGLLLVLGVGAADDEDLRVHDRAVETAQAREASALLADVEMARLVPVQLRLQCARLLRLRGLAVDDVGRNAVLGRLEQLAADAVGVLHARDRQPDHVALALGQRAQPAGVRVQVAATDQALQVVEQREVAVGRAGDRFARTREVGLDQDRERRPVWPAGNCRGTEPGGLLIWRR